MKKTVTTFNNPPKAKNYNKKDPSFYGIDHSKEGDKPVTVIMCGRGSAKNTAEKYERLLESNKRLLAENRKLRDEIVRIKCEG